MFKPGFVRVITEEAHERSVKLHDLIQDTRWVAAVEASALHEHYLSVMTYEDFIASESSRVLSYRWNEKISFDNTPVCDPAHEITMISGDVALSVLKTPVTGWKILWADALNHLNEPSGVALTIATMGQLYLAVRTLPQYFLTGDLDSIQEAVNRGWMHQELAYGALDHAAVWSFIEILARAMPRQWRGNPFSIPPFVMLMQFVAKRVRSAGTEVPLDSRLEAIIQSRRPDMMHTIDASYAMFCMHILAYMMKIIGSESSVFGDLRQHLSVETCREAVSEYINEVASLQLCATVEENLSVLRSNAVFCIGVIRACASTNFWDTSDAYVAAISVLGHACGITVEDPLKDYRAQFTHATMPRNEDGTLRYSHNDLNLPVLNSNLELLRICWQTVSQGQYKVPYAFKSMNDQSRAVVDLTRIPIGMHTLGVGLIPAEDNTVEGAGYDRKDAKTPEKPRDKKPETSHHHDQHQTAKKWDVNVGRHCTFTFNEKRDSFEAHMHDKPLSDGVAEVSVAPFPSTESLVDPRYVQCVGAKSVDAVNAPPVVNGTEADARSSDVVVLPLVGTVPSKPATPASAKRETSSVDKLPPI